MAKCGARPAVARGAWVAEMVEEGFRRATVGRRAVEPCLLSP